MDDMRFLDRATMRLDGQRLGGLDHTISTLANPDIQVRHKTHRVKGPDGKPIAGR
ncbi:MAG: hypothetical protein M3R21_00295 [Candidatus Dormibacteraeota bacterium]|nr:hypothetical protein [Candidatus Dormibacteraeota bacterium]